MANESQPFYEKDGKYYLASGTEITKEDYDSLTEFGNRSVQSVVVQGDLLKLHQEVRDKQDPSSPSYEGPESAEGGTAAEVTATSRPEAVESGDEPLVGDDAGETSGPQGTTAHSTEEVTKSNIAKEKQEAPEPVVNETAPQKIDEEEIKQGKKSAEETTEKKSTDGSKGSGTTDSKSTKK